jgi:hypothetical protein
MHTTGGLTLGLGTRKSERRAMMGSRLCTGERQQPIRYVDVDVERSGGVLNTVMQVMIVVGAACE